MLDLSTYVNVHHWLKLHFPMVSHGFPMGFPMVSPMAPGLHLAPEDALRHAVARILSRDGRDGRDDRTTEGGDWHSILAESGSDLNLGYVMIRPGRTCCPGKCVLTAQGQCFVRFSVSSIWADG